MNGAVAAPEQSEGEGEGEGGGWAGAAPTQALSPFVLEHNGSHFLFVSWYRTALIARPCGART